ncbi:hypothetical protein [Beggiatoa leptomitoformis]|uniref:Uncharacterized protein n=1 Tax=Beggiatoa leptomitoformis TaxID=288004 RepID=A0A2N9YFJ8_9GAMM|nr:hypothetical protein [Beggiatoa leptomitoformis]ALG68428.1 hypothetical protein AL038_12860 [Beggiatoa leptomitoformis]AUI69243.1 hypothetical protein BLE401_11415 [Beggiatoa leptomitoformis]
MYSNSICSDKFEFLIKNDKKTHYCLFLKSNSYYAHFCFVHCFSKCSLEGFEFNFKGKHMWIVQQILISKELFYNVDTNTLFDRSDIKEWHEQITPSMRNLLAEQPINEQDKQHTEMDNRIKEYIEKEYPETK